MQRRGASDAHLSRRWHPGSVEVGGALRAPMATRDLAQPLWPPFPACFSEAPNVLSATCDVLGLRGLRGVRALSRSCKTSSCGSQAGGSRWEAVPVHCEALRPPSGGSLHGAGLGADAGARAPGGGREAKSCQEGQNLSNPKRPKPPRPPMEWVRKQRRVPLRELAELKAKLAGLESRAQWPGASFNV